MYSVKSRSGRRGTVLTNYAHDMTRLMLRAPISWFSSGPVSNVKMGRNVRQSQSPLQWPLAARAAQGSGQSNSCSDIWYVNFACSEIGDIPGLTGSAPENA